MKSADIERTLLGCEFFKNLEKNAIKKIADICEIRTCKAGESIYQQGDFGEYLYIVAEGRVDLERTIKIGSRQGRVVIAKLGTCAIFGCWSTLLDEAHNMMLTSICQKPSKLIVLKGSELRDLMTRDLQLGYNVMERLCFLLRERIQAAYGAMERI